MYCFTKYTNKHLVSLSPGLAEFLCAWYVPWLLHPYILGYHYCFLICIPRLGIMSNTCFSFCKINGSSEIGFGLSENWDNLLLYWKNIWIKNTWYQHNYICFLFMMSASIMPTLGGNGGKCCLRITKTPIAPIGQSKGSYRYYATYKNMTDLTDR